MNIHQITFSPTGAISLDNPKGNNHALCIGCMRCVAVCPMQARGIGERLKMLAAHLEPLCKDRKSNELFPDFVTQKTCIL